MHNEGTCEVEVADGHSHKAPSQEERRWKVGWYTGSTYERRHAVVFEEYLEFPLRHYRAACGIGVLGRWEKPHYSYQPACKNCLRSLGLSQGQLRDCFDAHIEAEVLAHKVGHRE